jgi:hypothetical protein
MLIKIRSVCFIIACYTLVRVALSAIVRQTTVKPTDARLGTTEALAKLLNSCGCIRGALLFCSNVGNTNVCLDLAFHRLETRQ